MRRKAGQPHKGWKAAARASKAKPKARKPKSKRTFIGPGRLINGME